MDGTFILLYYMLIGGIFIAILIPNMRDVPKRRQRREKIWPIANSLNWDFHPRYRLPKFEFLVNGNALNVMHGEIEGNVTYLFDVPIQTYFEPDKHLPGRGSMVTTTAYTKLVILLPKAKLPQLTLRPAAWGDNFSQSTVKSHNFTAYGDINMLTAVFTPPTIAHYEEVKDLYITIEKDKIILHFYKDKYLETTKERYLDLIGEGKYIHQLIAPLYSNAPL